MIETEKNITLQERVKRFDQGSTTTAYQSYSTASSIVLVVQCNLPWVISPPSVDGDHTVEGDYFFVPSSQKQSVKVTYYTFLTHSL